ncbi:GSCFA domain-containing protein [Psychroserpens sp. XS_ASV72]|uniref:GSCFA domain-containing protein n=1 Tax=Psychroserpens sp. XS_ASV72 TaxID=3241293 RepID=UPI0035173991
MELQTKLQLKQQAHNLIDYNSKIVLFGSCFSEHIAAKLDYYKFQYLSNPFGILFHPLAIERLVLDAINKRQFTEADVFLLNEQWHCFDAHSQFSNPSKEELIKSLNAQIEKTYNHLKSASHIIITLGTAWAYRFIEKDQFVANCHKVPQKQFLKELLSVSVITESLEAIVSQVRSINPKVNFIVTVSPVRHLKDGFVENTQSKSHLITAIHNVVDERQRNYYFPSYEIMLDELRDYRFYKEDMLHPNRLAIDYIWQYFKKVWISDEAISTLEDVEFIQKGLQHRPFNSKSNAHLAFLEQLENRKSLIKSRFSHIVF